MRGLIKNMPMPKEVSPETVIKANDKNEIFMTGPDELDADGPDADFSAEEAMVASLVEDSVKLLDKLEELDRSLLLSNLFPLLHESLLREQVSKGTLTVISIVEDVVNFKLDSMEFEDFVNPEFKVNPKEVFQLSRVSNDDYTINFVQGLKAEVNVEDSTVCLSSEDCLDIIYNCDNKYDKSKLIIKAADLAPFVQLAVQDFGQNYELLLLEAIAAYVSTLYEIPLEPTTEQLEAYNHFYDEYCKEIQVIGLIPTLIGENLEPCLIIQLKKELMF